MAQGAVISQQTPQLRTPTLGRGGLLYLHKDTTLDIPVHVDKGHWLSVALLLLQI
jgi:hypothetical protein